MAPRNVLLLSVDTWRADRMSLYGYERPTTPRLERFAENAIVCDNAYATGPFTQIACVPLFTSSRPLSYGGYDDGALGRPDTVFRHFQKAGHHTWGLSTIHWVSRVFGYMDGFDEASEVFLLNAIPGMALNLTRDTLHAWRQGRIDDAEMLARVTPVMGIMFNAIYRYCDTMLADGGALGARFPDSKMINDGYDFAKVRAVAVQHQEEFERDPLAYVHLRLKDTSTPEQWIAKDWRYKRHPDKLLGRLAGKAADKLLGPLNPGLARLRANRFGMTPDAHAIADDVIRALESRDPSQPFLIWAHFKDTHQPFVSGRGRDWFRQTPEYLDNLGYDPATDPGAVFKGKPKTDEDWQAVRSLYDCAMRSTDEALGRILDSVDAMGLGESTVIGLAGDHGEELGEHGDYGHAVCSYEHTSHIPMLFRAPGESGRRVDGFTSSLDFAPTVAELAGLDQAAGWEGSPVMSNAVAERDYMLTEAFCRGDCLFAHRPPYLGVRTKQYKYLWREYRDPFHEYGSGEQELYDLVADPGERNNIYSPDHPVVREMNPVLAARLAEIPEFSDQRITDAFDCPAPAASTMNSGE